MIVIQRIFHFFRIKTEKSQYRISLIRRYFTQYDDANLSLQNQNIIDACIGLCYPLQRKNRLRTTRADRIQTNFIRLYTVFSKYLAVVHIMANQFFNCPGIQRFLHGFIAQQIVLRQIVKSITNLGNIRLPASSLHNHHIQKLTLLGKVFLQLHIETTVRQIIHQHQTKQPMPVDFLHHVLLRL